MHKQRAFLADFFKGLIVAAVIFSTNAFASSNLFRLGGVPPIVGTTCDDFAYNEGQRLTKFVGSSIDNFVVTDSRCVPLESGDNIPQWNVEITYEGAIRLALVSTQDTTSFQRPGYKTLEACERDLAAEVALFSKHTKLPVFASYCKVPLFRSQKYEINVMGFGSPDSRPYTAHTGLFGQILNHSETSFVEMIKT